MPSSFPRSDDGLRADGFRAGMLGLALVALLLAGWSAWFFLARIEVYTVTSDARLEVERAVQPVEAPVAGRVVAGRALLGQDVQAGEVLFELDSRMEELQLEEERTREAAASSQLQALALQITSERSAFDESRTAAGVSVEEARARRTEAEAGARLAEQQLENATSLHRQGLLSDMALLDARTEAEKRRAVADTLRLAVSRALSEGRVRVRDQPARAAQLERERAALEGQRAASRAAISRLELEVDRRRIRAPAAGTVAEVAAIGVGAVVPAGERLASIVTGGQIRVTAKFAPAETLGRVRPGQRGRMRLDAFPWAQFGTLRLEVARIASEPRDGTVRVDLVPRPDAGFSAPLQHGLSGIVEVEVERVSPAMLVLRAAGARLSARR